MSGRKAQWPTSTDDEKRIKAWLARKKEDLGLRFSRAQAFALLTRRGLDVEESEAGK